MFLRHKLRRRTARSTAIGALSRTAGYPAGGQVQRHVLYLGEINDRPSGLEFDPSGNVPEDPSKGYPI